MRLTLYAATRVCACLAVTLIVVQQRWNVAFGQSDNAVVAVINGRSITQREVDESIISQLFPLEQQVYALRKAALDNLISRTILEAEAKKRGLSIEELRGQLTAGKVEVSKSQVEQVYAENASVLAAMSPDEAKERLRLDLESQARMKNYREALAELRRNSRIEFRLEQPRLPQVQDGDQTPAMGAKNAPVTITEFADFECPYCRDAQKAIKQVLQVYRTEVRLVFKHLPLGVHQQALPSARAAFCAAEQKLFWQYHDALFASDAISEETLSRLALEQGLNMASFKACLDSNYSRSAILKDVLEASHLGIKDTPTFVVNGRLFRGALTFENFKTVIEEELKLAQKAPRRE